MRILNAKNIYFFLDLACQMDPKWRQKGIQKSMFFLMVFRRPLETLIFLRRGRDGAAGEPRVSHFLQPTPQGGGILSKNIV